MYANTRVLIKTHCPPLYSKYYYIIKKEMMKANEMPEQETLDVLRAELQEFVDMLNESPKETLLKTMLFISPALTDNQEQGDEAQVIKEWWNNKTTISNLRDFCFKRNHKVNGEFNNWSSGFLGSRWTDCEINGRICRIAFYSRENNPNHFETFKEKYLYIMAIIECDAKCENCDKVEEKSKPPEAKNIKCVSLEEATKDLDKTRLLSLCRYQIKKCCPIQYHNSNQVVIYIENERFQKICVWLPNDEPFKKGFTKIPYQLNFLTDQKEMYQYLHKSNTNTTYNFNTMVEVIAPPKIIPPELPKRKYEDDEPIPKFEEKKLSPQKRTRLANEELTAKNVKRKAYLDEVEEKEKLRLKIEQEKKQKQKKRKLNNTP